MITCPSGWHDSKFHTSYYFNRASLVADPRFPCGRNESSFRRPLVHSASSVDLTKGKPWESRLIILFIISWDSRAERSGVALCGWTCCSSITMWNDVDYHGYSNVLDYSETVRMHTSVRLFFLFSFFSSFIRFLSRERIYFATGIRRVKVAAK